MWSYPRMSYCQTQLLESYRMLHTWAKALIPQSGPAHMSCNFNNKMRLPCTSPKEACQVLLQKATSSPGMLCAKGRWGCYVPKRSPATTPDSYRPILLLSVLSKVPEHHVYTIISDHLQTFHLLAESQWGVYQDNYDYTACSYIQIAGNTWRWWKIAAVIFKKQFHIGYY